MEQARFTPSRRAANYHIADVLWTACQIGTAATYTFTNVAANHTISATFAIDTYTITATAGANGSIDPSGATLVSYKQQPDLHDLGHHGWLQHRDVTVDGGSVARYRANTFSNVTANHTIDATFGDITAPALPFISMVSSNPTDDPREAWRYDNGDHHRIGEPAKHQPSRSPEMGQP